jgi:integrase
LSIKNPPRLKHPDGDFCQGIPLQSANPNSPGDGFAWRSPRYPVCLSNLDLDHPITPDTSCEPARHVSLEKGMHKRQMPNNVTQKGCLQPHGNQWTAILRDNVLQSDNTVKRQARRFPLGPLSTMTEQQARQKMMQAAAMLNSKTAPTKLPITLDQFSEQYYKPEVVQRLQKAGRDTSIWALDKHIIPALGDMAMKDITLKNLQELCDLKIKAGLSVQTVKHIKTRLSAIFKHALGHRILEGFNPATAIRLPKMTRRERFTPTEEQVGAQLAVLQDPSYSPCFEAVLWSCTNSPNYAEMAAVRWRRVNLTDQPVLADGRNLPAFTAAIREDYYGGEFSSTKTEARNRIIPLAPTLVPALTDLKARSPFHGPDDLVFCDEKGKPLSKDGMDHKLKKASKEAGIPQIRWHGLRRYFATQSDRLGMPQQDRQSTLGHSSAAMTTHYTEEDLDRRRPYIERIAQGLLKAAKQAGTRPAA